LGFAVPKTAEHQSLSWSFLKFLAKKDVASSFYNVTKLPTARLDLIVEQASIPELGVWVRQAKFAKNNFMPVDRELFKQEFSATVQEIVDKKLTSSLKLLKKLEAKISKNLKEYLTLEKVIQRPVKKKPIENPAK
jgi:ABC-type glycerol-3-phosphate transport system substrate-binding protein